MNENLRQALIDILRAGVKQKALLLKKRSVYVVLLHFSFGIFWTRENSFDEDSMRSAVLEGPSSQSNSSRFTAVMTLKLSYLLAPKALEIATTLKPDYSEAWILKGEILECLGQKEVAL